MKRRLLLGVLTLALGGLACSTLTPPPRPAMEWDPAPDVVIIEAYNTGGLMHASWLLSAIPVARVYGDGRIAWVARKAVRRHVYEGRLTSEQMLALLTQFSEAGFFGWNDSYEPEALVYDAGTTTLRVSLLGATHSVTGYFNGAPPMFNELLRTLGEGAGAAGVELVPTAGYLTALPLTNSGLPSALQWPADTVGFELAEAEHGRCIDGEAFALAWETINDLEYALVESGGQLYELVVQVPGLSQIEPPLSPSGRPCGVPPP